MEFILESHENHNEFKHHDLLREIFSTLRHIEKDLNKQAALLEKLVALLTPMGLGVATGLALTLGIAVPQKGA